MYDRNFRIVLSLLVLMCTAMPCNSKHGERSLQMDTSGLSETHQYQGTIPKKETSKAPLIDLLQGNTTYIVCQEKDHNKSIPDWKDGSSVKVDDVISDITGSIPLCSDNHTIQVVTTYDLNKVLVKSNLTTRVEPYPLLFTIVTTTITSVIFVLGILGNTLVVMVIARTRSMHTTTNCYLLSLAVADSLVLLSGTLPAIPEPFFRVDEWPYGRVMCSLLIFLQYLGVDCSAMSIMAFTVERYIAISYPMRAQTVCTVSRAKRIIVGFWVVTFLYCSSWLGLTELKEHQVNGQRISTCSFRLSRSSYRVLYMVDLIVFYVIPLLAATVLYLAIARILFQNRAMRKHEHLDHGVDGRSQSKRRRPDSRTQVVRMLVVVVVVFAALWMPYRVVVVYNSFSSEVFKDMWFFMFARTMVYVNCAINPVLYNIMSVKFKRAFRSYLLCCQNRLPVRGSNFDLPLEVTGTRQRNLDQHCSSDPRDNNRNNNMSSSSNNSNSSFSGRRLATDYFVSPTVTVVSEKRQATPSQKTRLVYRSRSIERRHERGSGRESRERRQDSQ